MNIQPPTTKKPDTQFAGLFNEWATDWGAMSEPEAIMELCNRLNIRLNAEPDNRLLARDNTGALQGFLRDITDRYRGAIIAHLLELPAPEISEAQDSQNIAANCQSIDVTIAEYCAAVGHTQEYRDRLLLIRREMAPAQLVQNLCAFRAWLYEATLRKEKVNAS